MTCKNCKIKQLELEYKVDRNHDIVFVILVLAAALGFLFPSLSKAETYKYKNKLTVTAPTYKEAARRCYSLMTHNKYPGEQKGLEIIDICANPITGEIK